ncbi:MAG: VOC family protein [Thermoleophilaceae bacterium]
MPVNMIPALLYDDAKAAIEFLCDAFGFERKEVHEDDEGVVVHAELTYGDGLVMLGNTRESSEYARTVRTPKQLGGITGSIYVVVEDADAHHHQAKSAGADVGKLTDQDYGSREYSARDGEGHLWNFGTYQP